MHDSIIPVLLLALVCGAIAVKSAEFQCYSDAVVVDSRAVESCPPFPSKLPFPFSAIPGCGHPLFQIKCAAPLAILSINNLSFSVLHFQQNYSTLLLSPSPDSKSHCIPHTSNIPSHSINLSATPFRLSNSYCSHLTVLSSCSKPSNCTRCPFHCSLLDDPLNLLSDGCSSHDRDDTQQSGICQDDILGYLDRFLADGFEVEYDLSSGSDSFFSSCAQCKANNGFCGFNSTDPGKGFICFNSTGLSRTQNLGFLPPWVQEHYPRWNLVSAVFVFICFIVCIVTVMAAVLRYRRLIPVDHEQTASILHRCRSPDILPLAFTYEELEKSTSRFDPKRKIGDGGFGSVFLGVLPEGRVVAIKCLHGNNGGKRGAMGALSTSFCNEIFILSSLSHPNLVKLHGYCSDPRRFILVYDYVPNGTLADHLHFNKGSAPLTWLVRLEISLQIALALEYLHFSVSPAIVHRDVTSSNIFVERDMTVKLGDFGLSRLLVCGDDAMSSSSGSECVFTGPQGTPGYLDPDYHKCFQLTVKSDVYSFGVVLLELVSGMKAVDRSRDKREVALADLAVSKIQMGLLNQIIDSDLINGDVPADGVNEVAELAFRCLAADKDDRPDSREIVKELRWIRTAISGCPTRQMSSHPTS